MIKKVVFGIAICMSLNTFCMSKKHMLIGVETDLGMKYFHYGYQKWLCENRLGHSVGALKNFISLQAQNDLHNANDATQRSCNKVDERLSQGASLSHWLVEWDLWVAKLYIEAASQKFKDVDKLSWAIKDAEQEDLEKSKL